MKTPVVRSGLTVLVAMAAMLVPSSSVDASASGHCAGGVAGDFNGDGFVDAAIGAPTEDVGGKTDAGAVFILYGSATGLTDSPSQLWTQDSLGVLGDAAGGDLFGFCLAAGNINGDLSGGGFPIDDLAIGVPGEDVSGKNNAGAVNVLFGDAAGAGLSEIDDDYITQNSPSIQGASEVSDRFGSALVIADFNGKQNNVTALPLLDLAIGVPFEDIGTKSNAGAVNVVYGAADGLTATGNQLWHQASSGIEGSAENGDGFGSALTAGNFDGSTNTNTGLPAFDLAIGVPSEDVLGANDAGAVNVIYGFNKGLRARGDQVWYQGVTQIGGTISGAPEPSDGFGSALAAANFDADGFDDLAIGVPFEDATANDEGAVQVIEGSATKLTGAANLLCIQAPAGAGPCDDMTDDAALDDHFGATLVAGFFNADAFADLVVGRPLEDDPIGDEGAVSVIFGSGGGLTETGVQNIDQDDTGIETGEAADAAASSLTAGNFDGAGNQDLLIGIPLEDVGAVGDAGAVIAIYGVGAGLSAAGPPAAQLWHQDSTLLFPATDPSENSEMGDAFGSAVG